MSVSRRATDAFALQVMLGLCLIWGVQQVIIKLAAPDIAPVMQAAMRSGISALLVGLLICWKGGENGRGIEKYRHMRRARQLQAFGDKEKLQAEQATRQQTATPGSRHLAPATLPTDQQPNQEC